MAKRPTGTADRPITLSSDSDEAELEAPPGKQARRPGAAKGKAREQHHAAVAAAATAAATAAAMAARQKAGATAAQQKVEAATEAAKRAKTQASTDEEAVALTQERDARASAAAESACADHRVAVKEKAAEEAALATAKRRLADAEARERTALGAKKEADAEREEARRAREEARHAALRSDQEARRLEREVEEAVRGANSARAAAEEASEEGAGRAAERADPTAAEEPHSAAPTLSSSRPPSAASSSCTISRPASRQASVVSSRAAPRRRALADAREWRERAGTGPPPQAVAAVDVDDDEALATDAGPEQELADLIELLRRDATPPLRPVQNAQQLLALLERDPAWLELHSRPMCLARHSGGAMRDERLLAMFADDDTPGGRVAWVMRAAQAQRHWSLGDLDEMVKQDRLMAVHEAAEAAHKGTSYSYTIRDQGCQHGKECTVKEWLERCEKEVERKRKRSCGDQLLPKLLHWPLGKSPLEPLLRLPEWLEGANWVGSGYAGATFETKLQLVYDMQDTGQHFDNTGCDTWMKLLSGKVLVACWSFADARRHGADRPDPAEGVDWGKLVGMASARLFTLRQGDVLVMPAGTFHYVYTVRRKLVVAGDFCNASGWRTRAASVAFFGDDPAHNKGLDRIFNDGAVRVEAPRARALLAEGSALTAERRAYLEQVLAWAEELRAEVPKVEGREATLKPKVEEALLDVRRALETL